MVSLSVIIPTYNHEKYISDCLDSLVNQSLAPYEIIVIDDCSTDKTQEILEQYKSKLPQLKSIRNEKNLGVALSMHKGALISSGSHMCFFASDDIWNESHSRRISESFEKYPQAKLLCSAPVFFSQSIKETYMPEVYLPSISRPKFISATDVTQYLNFSERFWIPGNTAVIERQIYNQMGPFQVSTQWYCDWLLYHEVAILFGFIYLPEKLSFLRVLGSAYSHNMKDPIKQRGAIIAICDYLKDEKHNHYRKTLLATDFFEYALPNDYLFVYWELSKPKFMSLLFRRYFKTPIRLLLKSIFTSK